MAAIPAAALQAEIETRNAFIRERLRRKANRAELKDLTDFMHDGPARLLRCVSCGLAVRDEPEVRAADSYEEDPNDPDLMQHVYPRYVEAFRKKAEAWRDRLRPGASVIEVGSHLGGFLQAAEEWNWRPVGLDIGKDTSEFARHQGLTVRRETPQDTLLPAASADGVFIWNCFEQLAEPGSALENVRRLLRPGGLLALRVPNLRFYLECRSEEHVHNGPRPPEGRPRVPDPIGAAARGLCASDDTDGLAWNNLLGFPYLYGYTAESLNRLAVRSGFEPVRGYNSELITLPFPDPSTAVSAEQIANSRRIAEWSSRTTSESGALTGPWIEVIYRKMPEAQRRVPKLDLTFLERAA
jgi:SAM-dependent methyltransferase